MYALLEGISNALGIERNDINGVVELNLDMESYDLLIYDNVPGGAGHVKRLVDKNSIILSLKAALNKVSQECCDKETTCYNCLRNYYNQSHHSKLKRSYAQEYIEELIDIENYTPETVDAISNKNGDVGLRKSTYTVSDSDKYKLRDTTNSLISLLELTKNDKIKSAVRKLIDYSMDKEYEYPFVDSPIIEDETYWPDLFWGKSKVALFLPESEEQYLKLKIYDWKCYLITEDIEVEEVFKYIEKEG